MLVHFFHQGHCSRCQQLPTTRNHLSFTHSHALYSTICSLFEYHLIPHQTDHCSHQGCDEGMSIIILLTMFRAAWFVHVLLYTVYITPVLTLRPPPQTWLLFLSLVEELVLHLYLKGSKLHSNLVIYSEPIFFDYQSGQNQCHWTFLSYWWSYQSADDKIRISFMYISWAIVITSMWPSIIIVLVCSGYMTWMEVNYKV